MKRILLAALAAFSLSACGKEEPPKVIYVDSVTGREMVPAEPIKMMRHFKEPVVCIGGHQAYIIKQSYGDGYLWVHRDGDSRWLKECDENTKADGEQL